MARKILYISGSVGLGHVTRDLAIVRELRALQPNLEVTWLAQPPATDVLEAAGEPLLPEWREFAQDTEAAEASAVGYSINMLRYLRKVTATWSSKARTFRRVMQHHAFDLVVGDESYELLIALLNRPDYVEQPFVMMYDFLGVQSLGNNPLEWMGAWGWNRLWAQDEKIFSRSDRKCLFIGELEDIQDERFGVLLPNKREHAQRLYEFVGHALRFDAAEVRGRRAEIRRRLGVGDDEKLVVASIGGSGIGAELLQRVAEAHPLLSARVPGVRTRIVAGPRLDPSTLRAPEGVEVVGFEPQLYEWLAASDAAVVQGGGTTTLELTALRRPFLYFPLEGWSEQEVNVAGRCERHGAGVRRVLSQTSAEDLAEAVAQLFDTEPQWADVPVDGARKAAAAIAAFAG
jgi:UDP:flavonoid glycosyltransferase YjiC (YdhE family)